MTINIFLDYTGGFKSPFDLDSGFDVNGYGISSRLRRERRSKTPMEEVQQTELEIKQNNSKKPFKNVKNTPIKTLPKKPASKTPKGQKRFEIGSSLNVGGHGVSSGINIGKDSISSNFNVGKQSKNFFF